MNGPCPAEPWRLARRARRGRVPALLALALLGGCSSVIQQQRDLVGALPGPALTSFSPALHCVRRTLDAARARGEDLPRYLLVIDRIKDNTIRSESFASGPLSEGGEKWLAHAFKTALGSHAQVPVSTPQSVRRFFDDGAPLRGEVVGLYRERYKVDGVLAINGGFTINDSGTFNRGIGSSAAYTDSSNLYELGYALSQQDSTLSADIALGEPLNNLILRTYSLTIKPEQSSSTITFDLGYEGLGFSAQNQDIVLDGTHNAQKTLMEAVAFRIVTDLFEMPFEMCLYAAATGPLDLVERMAAFRATPSWERRAVVARALAARGYLPEDPGPASATAFRSAARAFLEAKSLPPVTPDDLARLYLYILVAEPLDRDDGSAEGEAH